ncbi:MAG: 30S ribosomal protein S20 [Spirochaetota bacterium]
MPSKRSAEKRHRQSVGRRLRNRRLRSNVKTEVKKFLEAVNNSDKAAADQQYNKVIRLIDTAAGKGLFHKNNAARKKSRLHKHLVNMITK